MREYMLGIFAVSLVLGVLEAVTYKSGGRGERAAFAVIIAFAVISPIEGLVLSEGTGLPVFSPEYSQGDELYEQKSLSAFEEGVLREISENFNINKEYIRVRCVGFSFKEMRCERISVTLSVRAAAADPKKIKSHIEKFNCGECEVSFELG